jgi:hypothetical protein
MGITTSRLSSAGSQRAFLLIVVVLVAGCSSTGSLDGPVLRSPTQIGAGGMEAEIVGVLQYDESSNCLLLEANGVLVPIVWPSGTRWSDERAAVVVEGDQIAEIGATVSGAGGYIKARHVEDLAGAQVAAEAERCAGPTGEIAFFNIGSTVEVASD